MIYNKVIPDSEFDYRKGQHFDYSWYSVIVSKDSDGYYYSDSGKKKVLFKFRKSVISQNLQQIATNTFLKESKKRHSNRGLAAGILPGRKTSRILTKTGQNEGEYVSSNISGYFDRPLRSHIRDFKTKVACRTTAFNLKNMDKWNLALPFIQKCSREYSRLGGKEYSLQKKEYSLVKNELKIPGTVFTTITSNYNFRTACHKDTGDYPLGLGNLIIVGKEYTGGYIGFPQFKVLIKIEPGDFLLMDVHQWHCNTPIKLTSNKGFRLSFVMYLRKDMVLCRHKKTIDKNIYYY